jgi:DNA-binding transcriptional regulator YiaG
VPAVTGDELKKARERLGISQLSLAVLVQVGLRQIEEFEAGKSPLPSGIEKPLQRAIQAAVDELWRSSNPTRRSE